MERNKEMGKRVEAKLKLTAKLLELFEKEKARSPGNRAVVFWYDEDGEGRDLEEIRPTLEEQGIRVWELTQLNAFRTKYKVEVEEQETSFLLYAPFVKPPDHKNLLLDIFLYSTEFKTDEIALLAEELGLDATLARPFLQRYRVFFREKQRKEKFRRFLPLQGDERDWKAAVFAVLTQAKSTEPTDLVRSVLERGLDEEKNQALTQIRKFAHADDFYDWLYAHFGLVGTDSPTLREVFATLVQCHAVTCTPELEKHFPSFHTRMPNTCYVFLEDWLREESGRTLLRPLLKQLEAEWGLGERLRQLPPDQVADCRTFQVADTILIEYLNEMLLHHGVTGRKLHEIIDKRLNTPWAREPRIRSVYQFFTHALAMVLFSEEERRDHHRMTVRDWLKAYSEHDYKVDQIYRKMMWIYRQAGMPEVLKEISDWLTQWYEDEFLHKWGAYTDGLMSEKLTAQWPVEGVLQQSRFFRDRIAPLVNRSPKRIFVILSDALRFEAGAELSDKLGRRLNAEVSLEPMQAALPSCTQLGMAALLPGEVTDIDDQGTVFVEGIPAKGMKNREKILQKAVPESAVFRLDDFIHLGKEKGLKAIKGKRVIYLYHNRIDATGDHQVTENYTFDDVHQAVEELTRVVGKLTGTFGAKRIFITADHGFLYQQTAVQADRLAERVAGSVIEQHRRYAIGRDLVVPPGVQRVSLDYLNLELEAAVPKGLNRFKSGGGMKFVHGGPMPQEAVVPVIQYREIHGQARKKEEQRIDVRVAMRSKVITHYRFNVLFFQEQKVSQDLRPRHLRVALYLEDDRISNEVNLVFDSEQEAPERHQEVSFTLIEGRYPVGEACMLRMEDVTGTKTELYGEEPFELRVYDI
ncbi:BREX-1 system phosphatase PglZ type A [Paludifilum halophilum]|uniref:TIGR02687 family protein n=1 Tax=Paludifilum halophilum TaxID=1642702 RepID=A0A235B626_9BACL|nr:BREX-1 system phosphatase PglZ type A [Paludifilum halophilum]OYD07754.1 TIGR02687 family protein [Paludifilum halophilum]